MNNEDNVVDDNNIRMVKASRVDFFFGNLMTDTQYMSNRDDGVVRVVLGGGHWSGCNILNLNNF
jgi:hypothetical protein